MSFTIYSVGSLEGVLKQPVSKSCYDPPGERNPKLADLGSVSQKVVRSNKHVFLSRFILKMGGNDLI